MEHVVLFSTDQGDRLRTAFESMRDFVNEIKLKFSKSGIELLGQDKAHVILLRFVLPAKKIRDTGGTYEHNAAETVEVGVKTKLIATCLKCAAPGDTVSLGIDPAVQGRLILTCRNGSRLSRWEIVMPEMPDDEIESDVIDRVHYSGSITMASSLFHDMIRDLSTARDPSSTEPATVRLCCDGSRLVLSAEGIMTRVSFEVVDETSGASFLKSSTGGAAWPVQETYAIVFLQRIAKAKNICSRITIHVRPNFPAAFVYDSPIGTLTYIVAPRDEDDLEPPPKRQKNEDDDV